MNKRRFTLVFVCIVIGVLAWVFWGKPPKAVNEGAATTGRSSTNSLSEASQDISTNAMTQPLDEKRVKAMRDTILSQNIPIKFWGKVVDQDNQPLDGVKVKLYTMRGNEYAPGKFNYPIDYQDFTTSTDGSFTLTDATGYTLTIESIAKEGYELAKGRMTFGYNGSRDLFVPESQHPVIFKMWKKGVPEPLIFYHKNTRIPYDGTPITLDLAKGKYSTDANAVGDLRITLLRSPLKIKWGTTNFDWQAAIEAIDGGIIETKDEFMYRAPEEGYSPQIEIKMAGNDPNWTSQKELSFYLKSRGGKYYSRVTVEFRTDSDQETTGFTFTSYVNPNGSRNLEFDPFKKINAQ